ncbi:hypothetical protein F4781DRAFT_379283 [Annulohypoxylon bovei var. microspora]|nr:hypothetical protein F4781DRAFT_379283 [Annulohypoxylon bovei var. microspora]
MCKKVKSISYMSRRTAAAARRSPAKLYHNMSKLSLGQRISGQGFPVQRPCPRQTAALRRLRSLRYFWLDGPSSFGTRRRTAQQSVVSEKSKCVYKKRKRRINFASFRMQDNIALQIISLLFFFFLLSLSLRPDVFLRLLQQQVRGACRKLSV